MRLALKLATGAGKTAVMAMIIAWQTINAVRRPGSTKFTKDFLVVTPGLTISDWLRALQPNDPDSYYASRKWVPNDMLGEVDEAEKNTKAARPWISGMEIVKGKLGMTRIIDSLGDAVLPLWLGLCRRHPVRLDDERLFADGRDRIRHREAAARAGGRQQAVLNTTSDMSDQAYPQSDPRVS